ncbi:hypothetical protein [Polaribacter marinivivus]|uniref:DUF4325 domain-containing protein n=1 Tax=Polaribacter marinivivus TaxID=1524260 RepID=A0ABV8RAM3_9FLAO
MNGISKIIIDLSKTTMFSGIESLDFKSKSKDHIGELLVTFNNQKINVDVFNNDDYESVAKRIINKAKF